MKTQIQVVKQGVDHVELQVETEAAADLVADEAHRQDIQPVIGQRRGFENTSKHYVVLHARANDVLAFLEQNPNFDLVSRPT